MTKRGQLAGECADDVVCLKALVVKDRDTKGLKRSTNVGLLLNQIRRSLSAVGLVTAVLDDLELLRLDVELLDVLHLCSHLVTMDRRANIVDGRKILRLEVL